MGVRTKRLLIAFCYHAGLLLLSALIGKAGLVLQSPALFKLGGIILVGDILTFRIIPVSRWLQEWLIPEAVCPGCGTVIELVGIYRCGCGFMSHKERHVFTPCKMCGKDYSWVICVNCETSILI